jgi:uncharacterized protein
MVQLLDWIRAGIGNALLMAYDVWWALVFGFAISAIVQAWVPRAAIERRLSGEGAAQAAWATGLGAASSSCSYAAVAIAKSLFQKGASLRSALAFQFASTNLVWELGLVLWVLIGWQFTLAEYVGGIVLIVILWIALRLFVSPEQERVARTHAQAADTGHQHHMSASDEPWRRRLVSVQAWSDVAHNFRGDWQMLYREIGIGFLLAGFIGLLGNGAFRVLFLTHAPAPIRIAENVVIGPVVAILSFVCSIGNVPLAAVLWSGGLSFAGVVAFIFADLIVLPIVLIYRKYYGGRFAVRITLLMLVTMIVAALIIDGLFSVLGLVPTARPVRADVFGRVAVDYKLVLNALGVVVFVALMAVTLRRGATDPVCGMAVDRAKAIRVSTNHESAYLCSPGCAETYRAHPDRYAPHRERHPVWRR